MKRSFKLFLAFIAAITISIGFVISDSSNETNETVKTGHIAVDTGFLDDGMKKAILIARDEL